MRKFEGLKASHATFAAQLADMIRDFERQTGASIEAINIERSTHKIAANDYKPISIFKSVYVALEK